MLAQDETNAEIAYVPHGFAQLLFGLQIGNGDACPVTDEELRNGDPPREEAQSHHGDALAVPLIDPRHRGDFLAALSSRVIESAASSTRLTQ